MVQTIQAQKISLNDLIERFGLERTEFRFLKLTKQGTPKYAPSYLFSLDSRDDLYTVLRILKRLGQLVSQ